MYVLVPLLICEHLYFKLQRHRLYSLDGAIDNLTNDCFYNQSFRSFQPGCWRTSMSGRYSRKGMYSTSVTMTGHRFYHLCQRKVPLPWIRYRATTIHQYAPNPPLPTVPLDDKPSTIDIHVIRFVNKERYFILI